MTTAPSLPFPAPASAAAPTLSTTAPRRFRFRARHVVLGLAGVFLVLVLAFVLSFRIGGETRALRQAALSAAPGRWDRQFEIGIGRLPVLLAKAGLGFLPLEPEVRAALASFESADVSIYERHSEAAAVAPGDGPAPDLLASVSAAMARQGWEPVVRVRDGQDTIGVFVPTDAGRSTRLRACVLVLDRNDLVIVSARANPEPLIQLALQRAHGFRIAAE